MPFYRLDSLPTPVPAPRWPEYFRFRSRREGDVDRVAANVVEEKAGAEGAVSKAARKVAGIDVVDVRIRDVRARVKRGAAGRREQLRARLQSITSH